MTEVGNIVTLEDNKEYLILEELEKDGTKYLGCNIENQGIQGLCAERCAFAKALSDGRRDFASITVVGSLKDTEPNTRCMPCGYCRQFMSEFVDENFKIYALSENDTITEYSLQDLLPHSFKL